MMVSLIRENGHNFDLLIKVNFSSDKKFSNIDRLYSMSQWGKNI